MPTHINILQIDDSSDKTIVGTITYDRTNGGILVIPAGTSFPSTATAGELFWRSDQNILYRRNDANTTWEALGAAPTGVAGGDLSGNYPNPEVVDLTISGETQGSVLYFDGTNWVQLSPGTSGQFLQTQGASSDPQWADASSGLVPNSRQVIAGDGLIGGGDLSADRTLDVVANADGSINVNANDIQVGVLATDAQHGNRGGGNLHSTATTSVAGFLSASDKTKLDGIEAGAQANDVDSVFGRTGAVVAQTSDYDANQVDFTPNGDIAATDVQAAIVEVRDDTDTKLTGKADVTHASDHLPSGSDPLTTATAVSLTPDLANAEGTAESFSRSDHVHNVPAATAVNIGAGGTSIEGTSTSFARADHIHRIIDPSTEVTSTTTVSTTSTSDIIVPGMTSTPGAGTYLVFFSSYGIHANNNASLICSIFANGVIQNQSIRAFGLKNSSDDTFFPIHCQCKVTVGAGQDIDVRYRRDGGSGAVFLYQRSLILIKVDD